MSDKFNNAIVEYESGKTTVKLSPGIIRNYLVSGNGKVSDQEIVMFLNLCKAQRLNPFLREAYLIKYGSAPATMIVGKDVHVKRAARNPKFAGYDAGIIVEDMKGDMIYRNGSLALAHDAIVGGWCKVHIKDYDTTIDSEVSFSEYCLMKDGKPASNWAKMPGTMIRKVAVSQALREAFPEDLQGLYDSSEMSVNDIPLDEKPVVIDNEVSQREMTAEDEQPS